MKIAVFIDGSNLYSKFKDLKIRKTSQFNYFEFIKALTKTEAPDHIGYYAGRVRRERNNVKSEKLYSDQQKFLDYLQNHISGINIILGHIQNFDGIYKEKGVDVRLALDIYRLAVENKYDKAIVISSDSDLLPAIRMVQTMGKEIEYIGFSHNPSLALIKECKSKKLLQYDDLKLFEIV